MNSISSKNLALAASAWEKLVEFLIAYKPKFWEEVARLNWKACEESNWITFRAEYLDLSFAYFPLEDFWSVAYRNEYALEAPTLEECIKDKLPELIEEACGRQDHNRLQWSYALQPSPENSKNTFFYWKSHIAPAFYNTTQRKLAWDIITMLQEHYLQESDITIGSTEEGAIQLYISKELHMLTIEVLPYGEVYYVAFHKESQHTKDGTCQDFKIAWEAILQEMPEFLKP